jgi:hypothetical protein
MEMAVCLCSAILPIPLTACQMGLPQLLNVTNKLDSINSVQDNSISMDGAMCPKPIVTGVLEFTGVLEYWSEGPMPAEHRFYQCSRHI